MCETFECETFECETFEYEAAATLARSNMTQATQPISRRYLYADLTLSCDSDEYVATRNAAFTMLTVRPIAIPLLYMVLLWFSRDAIRTGIPSPLSRATAFLSRGCRLLVGAARDVPQAACDGVGAADPRGRRAGPCGCGSVGQHQLLWAQSDLQALAAVCLSNSA
eukprot:7382237-Prymnesium_polylepis.5